MGLHVEGGEFVGTLGALQWARRELLRWVGLAAKVRRGCEVGGIGRGTKVLYGPPVPAGITCPEGC